MQSNSRTTQKIQNNFKITSFKSWIFLTKKKKERGAATLYFSQLFWEHTPRTTYELS